VKTKLLKHIILIIGLFSLASSCKKEKRDSGSDDGQKSVAKDSIKSFNFDALEFCQIERAGKKYKLKIIEFSQPVIHDLEKDTMTQPDFIEPMQWLEPYKYTNLSVSDSELRKYLDSSKVLHKRLGLQNISSVRYENREKNAHLLASSKKAIRYSHVFIIQHKHDKNALFYAVDIDPKTGWSRAAQQFLMRNDKVGLGVFQHNMESEQIKSLRAGDELNDLISIVDEVKDKFAKSFQLL
jgi:hypothetical protein